MLCHGYVVDENSLRSLRSVCRLTKFEVYWINGLVSKSMTPGNFRGHYRASVDTLKVFRTSILKVLKCTHSLVFPISLMVWHCVYFDMM